MSILVSDTSVLVDLDRGGLLEAAFTCGLVMIVPDILYERELAEHNGAYLRKLGLGVVTLEPAEVQLAQEIMTARSKLSLMDCLALSCATRAGHTLVTGDKALRTEAAGHGVQVVGLLWLLEAMESAGVSNSQLHSGLTRISEHIRCRLPAGEVKGRLARWA